MRSWLTSFAILIAWPGCGRSGLDAPVDPGRGTIVDAGEPPGRGGVTGGGGLGGKVGSGGVGDGGPIGGKGGTSPGGATGGSAVGGTGGGTGRGGTGAGTGGHASSSGGGSGADGGGAGTTGASTGKSFSSVNALTPYRVFHTATLLQNGKVLIGGGQNERFEPLDSMELFDPSTRMFSSAGAMVPGRFSHTATLLVSGEVLFTGGYVGGGNGAASTCAPLADLYDPETATLSSLPSLASYQCDHAATLLADGRVLIVGLYADARAELFDPAAGGFTSTGPMVEVRMGHTATLLKDGRVLVAGGVACPAANVACQARYVASAEVYNPSTGSFSSVGSMSASRAYHTATVLPDGHVLVAGGIETFDSTEPTFRPDAEVFDPATNSFAPGPPLVFAYHHATATGLLDSTVLVVGGFSPTGPQIGCQLYDPARGAFSATASLAIGRYVHTANLLPTGGVLIVGGRVGLGIHTVPAEIYE